MNDNELSTDSQETRRRFLYTYLSIACIIVFSVALFVNKMMAPRVMSVKELVNNGVITYQEPKTLLPFQLIDHNGETFDPSRLQGHWTLLFFGFTHCPDFCPATLAILKSFVAGLNDETRADLQVMMVSVDPARDTPARMKDYMTTFNPNFVGITGDMAQIKLLADQLYIPFHQHPTPMPAQNTATHMDHGEHGNVAAMNDAEENYTVPHGENIVLINPQGQYHAFFKPPFTQARLKATYRSVVATYQP